MDKKQADVASDAVLEPYLREQQERRQKRLNQQQRMTYSPRLLGWAIGGAIIGLGVAYGLGADAVRGGVCGAAACVVAVRVSGWIRRRWR